MVYRRNSSEEESLIAGFDADVNYGTITTGSHGGGFGVEVFVVSCYSPDKKGVHLRTYQRPNYILD